MWTEAIFDIFRKPLCLMVIILVLLILHNYLNPNPSLMRQRCYILTLLTLMGIGLQAQCPPQSLPYQENFNSGLGCFTVVDGGNSSLTWAQTPTGGSSNVNGDLDSTGFMLVDSDDAGASDTLRETLVSPYIDASSLNGSLLLEWDQYYNALSTDSGTVEVYDGSQWVTIYTIRSTAGGFGNPDRPQIDISAYANDSLQIRFIYDDAGSWAWYWLIDNVNLAEVSCPDPSSAQVVSTSASSALVELSSPVDSVQVEWGPTGFSQGTGCSASLAVDTSGQFTIDTANLGSCSNPIGPNNCYDFYLRRNCSSTNNGFSSWVGPFSFCTQCNAVSLPYTENFNNGLGCFTALNGSASTSPDTWIPVASGGNSNLSGDLDGTDYVAVDSDGAGSGPTFDELLVSPKVLAGSITSGALILEYDHYYRSVSGDSGMVEVYDGSQWQNIQTFTSDQGSFSAPAHEFIDISAYANDSLQVRFVYRDGGNWAWHWAIDNVELQTVSCSPSSNLQASFVGTDTIQLNWNGGSAPSYEVEYGPTGFSLGGGTRLSTSADSAGIGSLSPQTTYDIYILDSCSTGISDTLGPLTITTACTPQSIPYFEDFDNGQGCFTIQDGGTSSDTWINAPSGGTGNTNGDLNGTPHMLADSDGAGTGVTMRETLTSPPLDASSFTNGTLQLTFLQFFRPLGDSAVVEIYDGSQWVHLATFNSTLGAFAAPDSQSIDVSAYANANFQVRFIYDDGGGYNWWWALDNFRVEGFPCSSASNLDTSNVQPTSADLSWNSSAGLFNINWGPTGFRQGTGASGNFVRGTSQNPYSLTGLQPSTCYDYYVQDSCAGTGVGPWVGPFTFCTPATCPAPTNLAATNIQSNSADLNWSGGSGNFEVLIDTTGTPSFSNAISVSSNSYSATGLNSATNYCFYVREICAPGDSSTWTGPVCFTTSCNTFTAPFLEDFETSTSTCWSNDTVLGANQWSIGTGSSGGSISSAYSGSNNAVFTSSFGGPFVTRFVSPVIDASNLSSTELTFYYGQEVWFGDQNALTVYYRTSPNSSWVEVFKDTTDVPAWTKATVSIPSQSPTLQVAFEGEDNFGRANVIDDVRIDVIGGSCTSPQGMAGSNADCESIQLNWTSSTGGSIIQYGPVGFTPGNGNYTTVVSPPYTLSGLQPSTAYDIYVADTCVLSSGRDTSNFVGPYTDSTNNVGLANASFTYTYDSLNVLDYTFTASGSANQYFWDFGDGNTGTGNPVSHSFANPGAYTVELILDATCGRDTATETIADVSVAEWSLAEALTIYPNPTSSSVTLDWGQALHSETDLRVRDLSGKTLLQKELNLNGESQYRLDLSKFAAGVYLVELNGPTGQALRRVTLLQQR